MARDARVPAAVARGGRRARGGVLGAVVAAAAVRGGAHVRDAVGWCDRVVLVIRAGARGFRLDFVLVAEGVADSGSGVADGGFGVGVAVAAKDGVKDRADLGGGFGGDFRGGLGARRAVTAGAAVMVVLGVVGVLGVRARARRLVRGMRGGDAAFGLGAPDLVGDEGGDEGA